MIQLDVRSGDVLTFMQRFGVEARKAIAIAINRTGELAMAEATKEIRSHFTVRAPGFILPPRSIPNAYRATPENLAATVDIAYGDEPGSIGAKRNAILSKFEAGGTKTTRDPNYPVAIPTQVLRPSPQDLVARGKYPRNLVGAFNALGEFQGLGSKASIKTRLKKLKGSGEIAVSRKQVGRYFTLGTLGEKSAGVYERFGPKRDDVRMLWAFRTSIPIPASLRFTETISQTVDARFAGELAAALAHYAP